MGYGLKDAEYMGYSVNDGRKIDHIFILKNWSIESTETKVLSGSDYKLVFTKCILK